MKACQASIEGEPTRLAASLGVPMIVLPFYPLSPQEQIASSADLYAETLSHLPRDAGPCPERLLFRPGLCAACVLRSILSR